MGGGNKLGQVFHKQFVFSTQHDTLQRSGCRLGLGGAAAPDVQNVGLELHQGLLNVSQGRSIERVDLQAVQCSLCPSVRWRAAPPDGSLWLPLS